MTKTNLKPETAVKPPKNVSKQFTPIPDTTYGSIETVTAMRLKRRLVNEPYYAKFFLPDSSYTWLNALGIQMGVTWDEVLRGLIEQHQASADQVTGLSNFVPALM